MPINQKYIYVGCFVLRDALLQKMSLIKGHRLDKIIQYPHITFEYKPTEIDEELFGQEIEIVAFAYGNDGQNEGLKVELNSQNECIEKMISNIRIPHITVSVCKTGKPVNTSELEFHPIEPFKLKGKYGGYCKNGSAVTERL